MVYLEELDSIDRRILREVQIDGRISIVELAERVGLSKSPCQKRLKRLERDEIIRGYYARLDADKVRQGYVVFVQVKLNGTRRHQLEKFNAAVRKIPQILSCHMMSGGYDYLLKIRTRDMQSYRLFLGETLSGLPGIDQTSTFPVMEQVKETNRLSISEE